MHTDPASNLLTMQSELIGIQLGQIAELQKRIRELEGKDYEAACIDAGNGYYLATFDGAPLPVEFEGGADGVKKALPSVPHWPAVHASTRCQCVKQRAQRRKHPPQVIPPHPLQLCGLRLEFGGEAVAVGGHVLRQRDCLTACEDQSLSIHAVPAQCTQGFVVHLLA